MYKLKNLFKTSFFILFCNFSVKANIFFTVPMDSKAYTCGPNSTALYKCLWDLDANIWNCSVASQNTGNVTKSFKVLGGHLINPYEVVMSNKGIGSIQNLVFPLGPVFNKYNKDKPMDLYICQPNYG